MGIASGIFWIVFGVGYIVYLTFKEHPRESVNSTAIFLVLGGAIATWVLVFNSLLAYDLTVATIFTVISVVVLVCDFVITFQKRNQERTERKSRYERALEIARSEPLDEDALKKFEDAQWARSYGPGKYQFEKYEYKFAIDKSQFRDLIVKDYIESCRVYQILATMEP